MRNNFYIVVLALLACQAFAFQGGPDGFGYYWESTRDPGDTITFAWIDPSSHPAITGWYPDEDDGCAALSLPFRFPFYGDSLDSLILCTNGFAQHPSSFTAYQNRPLPDSRFPCLIAVFWDDLNPGASGSIRRHADPGNRFVVVSWLDVVRFGTHDTLTFQLVVSSNGDIRMNYLRAPQDARHATVGIQGNSGQADNYLQYVCDGAPAERVITDSTSIRWYLRRLAHDVGVLGVASPEPWVPARAQVPVIGRFRNFGMHTESFPVRAQIVRARHPHDTVFASSREVVALEPGDSADCYFGDWLTAPAPDSWHVLLRTLLDRDLQPRNDTGRFRVSTIAPAFGAELERHELPHLGSGMNLAGVCHRPATDSFYLAVLNPNRVFSFASDGPPTLQPANFDLQSFYGDDIVWGIGWLSHPEGFWLGHTPARGAGTILARYAPDGSFTGDTWDISAVEPDAWFAGLAPAGTGDLYVVAAGGANRIHQLRVADRLIVRSLPTQPASYRACSWLGDHNRFLFTGGWNQRALLNLGVGGNLLDSTPCPDLADLAIHRPHEPELDSLVWAWATLSDEHNTLVRLSLGTTWRGVGLAADPDVAFAPAGLLLSPNPTNPGQLLRLCGSTPGGRLRVWDVTGRLIDETVFTKGVLREQFPACAPAYPNAGNRQVPMLRAPDTPGTYFVTLSGTDINLTGRLIVVRRSGTEPR